MCRLLALSLMGFQSITARANPLSRLHRQGGLMEGAFCFLRRALESRDGDRSFAETNGTHFAVKLTAVRSREGGATWKCRSRQA